MTHTSQVINRTAFASNYAHSRSRAKHQIKRAPKQAARSKTKR